MAIYTYITSVTAEPCSPWSLISESNVEKKCEKQGSSTVCTVKCNKGYTFLTAEHIPKQFVCTGASWSPTNVVPSCVRVAEEPARYELTISVDYIVLTPVGNDCLNVRLS